LAFTVQVPAAINAIVAPFVPPALQTVALVIPDRAQAPEVDIASAET
jgi:hypothetical protein